MSETIHSSRRDFLKLSALGALAAASASSGAASVITAPAKTAAAWTEPRPINPSIDNLRVVFAHDPAMVNTACADFSNFSEMAVQNNYSNKALIKTNLDKMAVALTANRDVAAAWNTIFRKPAAKSWADVTVAIKINAIGVNHPRLAVVGKICEELLRIGVQTGNITIYDASRIATTLYNPFVGSDIPAGITISNGGDKIAVPVADGSTMECTDVLVSNEGGSLSYTKDILVNIAVCKNHGWNYGQFTMTMKNHIGSLRFYCPSSADDLPNINRSEAILGSFTDPAIPPRQQLCIIDALWSSSSGGPSAEPDVDTNYLIMGTSSPIVDYLVATKIRATIVNDAPNVDLIEKFVTDFGHPLSDVQDLDMIDALDFINAIRSPDIYNDEGRPESLALIVAAGTFRSSRLSFSLPGTHYISSLVVCDMTGKMVRNLSASAEGRRHRDIMWDGKNDRGDLLATGTYAVRCTAGPFSESKIITLSRG